MLFFFLLKKLYRVYKKNWTNLKSLSGFVKRLYVATKFFIEIGC